MRRVKHTPSREENILETNSRELKQGRSSTGNRTTILMPPARLAEAEQEEPENFCKAGEHRVRFTLDE